MDKWAQNNLNKLNGRMALIGIHRLANFDMRSERTSVQ